MVIKPNDEGQIREAQESFRQLRRLLADVDELKPEAARLTLGSQTISVPAMVVQQIAELMGHLADGKAVSMVPSHQELTTQQAADLLNVSRPYVIRLLERGEIPFHLVGTHRRIVLRDLLAYKTKSDEESKAAIQELSAEAERMGLLN